MYASSFYYNSDYCNLDWLEWLKFTLRNSSLCRTWLLVWCLECAEVNTSAPVLEYLHWLPVSQQVVFKTALMVWKCVHGVAPAYLSDLCVPATAISGRQHLQRLAFYWFHVPGLLQLNKEVSQSTDLPHGTVRHQHYGHRTCRKVPSSGH